MWKIYKEKESHGFNLEQTYIVEGDKEVCSVFDTSKQHLIAAAPEMFDALEAALESLIDKCEQLEMSIDNEDINQIKNALNKARGELK